MLWGGLLWVGLLRISLLRVGLLRVLLLRIGLLRVSGLDGLGLGLGLRDRGSGTGARGRLPPTGTRLSAASPVWICHSVPLKATSQRARRPRLPPSALRRKD